ncbi:hypothetical protein K440DRAFT_631656 [Wilcoxina mikolae CBS 423.85]|nr:hypothetical protein K440DRAFT_631656 [Wilcoxina mikolae CBS 423.85]
MHDLNAVLIQECIDDNYRQLWLSLTVELCHAAIPDPKNHELWTDYDSHFPQLLSCFECCKKGGYESQHLFELLSTAGLFITLYRGDLISQMNSKLHLWTAAPNFWVHGTHKHYRYVVSLGISNIIKGTLRQLGVCTITAQHYGPKSSVQATRMP